jgi:hypothetical protein
VAISAEDAARIADGSACGIRLSFRPKLLGRDRLFRLLRTPLFGPLTEVYRNGKQWYELVVLLRIFALILLSTFAHRDARVQAAAIAFVQMAHLVLSLQRPHVDGGLNRIEVAGSAACLVSALAAAWVTSLLGSTSESSAGLETKGSAGAAEDALRGRAFTGLSQAVLLALLSALAYMAAHAALLLLDLLPRPRAQPPPPPEPRKVSVAVVEAEPAPIDPAFSSALHAVSEINRVLPIAGLCDCALGAVLGGVALQMEVEERQAFLANRRARQRPWVYAAGVGAAGFCRGREVLAFRNRLTGAVVEVASNSAGEIRIRPFRGGGILGLTNGILMERDSFFAPALVDSLEMRACDPSDTEGRGLDAALAAGDFGRWTAVLHTPDLLIAHSSGPVRIWLTRGGAGVVAGGGLCLLLQEGDCQLPRLEEDADAVADFVERGRPAFPDALSAIAAARR